MYLKASGGVETIETQQKGTSGVLFGRPLSRAAILLPLGQEPLLVQDADGVDHEQPRLQQGPQGEGHGLVSHDTPIYQFVVD